MDMERATLATWMAPEHSAWSFRHVRELMPTARVGAGAPTPLPETLIPDLAYTPVPRAENPVPLTEHLSETFASSLVVLKDGALVFEWYAPGVEPDDRHFNFSVTKSVTALLAGILADHDALCVDDPVTRFVPEAASSAFGDATVRELLDMAVAVDFTEDYAMNDPLMLDYRRAMGYLPGGEEGLQSFLVRLRSAGDNGVRFQYCSPTTDMLGWVLERAAGMPISNALSRLLWTPMGAELDGDLVVDRFGMARMAGGLSSTTRDMARIGQLVADGGRGIVPEWFIQDLLHGSPELWDAGADASMYPSARAYRSCWYTSDEQPGVLLAAGIHGQLIHVETRRNIVIARHSHWPDAKGADGTYPAVRREMAAIVDAIA